MSRTYSPTELSTFNDCPLKHHLRYNERLRLSDDKPSQALASGRAVHTAVQDILSENVEPSMYVSDDTMVGYHLWEALGGNDGTEERAALVKKFLPGVKRALSKVPDWVWEGEWHSESPVGWGPFYGYTDLWRLVDDGYQQRIEIVDIKTTDHPPLDYVLWTPQLRLYAYMLSGMHGHKYPVVYKYLCVPTSPSKGVIDGSWHAFTSMTQRDIEFQAAVWIAEIESGTQTPRESRGCSFCDYRYICQARITHGDQQSVKEELYYVKEVNDNNH